MPIDTGQRRRVASERRSKPGRRSWNRRSRGAQARALFAPTTHCLGGAVCGRASAKHRQQTPVHFGRQKPGKLCTQPKPHEPSLAAACPCRPVRRPRRPFIPRTLRLSAAAQPARASGCRSSAASQVWAGLLQDQHHIRSTACQACTANRPHRTASANARQIRRTSRGHWKRPALKTDTAR